MKKRLFASVLTLVLLLSTWVGYAQEVKVLNPPKNNPYTAVVVNGFEGVLYTYNNSQGVTQLRIYGKYNGKTGFFPAELTNEGVNIIEDKPVKETPNHFGKAKIAKELQEPEEGFKKTNRPNIFSIVNVFNKKEFVAYASYDGENYAYYPIGKNNLPIPGALALDLDGLRAQSKKEVGKSYPMPKEYKNGYAQTVILNLEDGQTIEGLTDKPELDIDALGQKRRTHTSTGKGNGGHHQKGDLSGINFAPDAKKANMGIENVKANISVKSQYRVGETVVVSSKVEGGKATLVLQVKDSTGKNIQTKQFKDGQGSLTINNLPAGNYTALSAVNGGHGFVGRDRKDFTVVLNPTVPSTGMSPQDRADDTYLGMSVSYDKTPAVNTWMNVLVTLSNAVAENTYTVTLTGIGDAQTRTAKGSQNAFQFSVPIQTTAQQTFTVQVLTQSGKNGITRTYTVNSSQPQPAATPVPPSPVNPGPADQGQVVPGGPGSNQTNNPALTPFAPPAAGTTPAPANNGSNTGTGSNDQPIFGIVDSEGKFVPGSGPGDLKQP